MGGNNVSITEALIKDKRNLKREVTK